MTKQSYENTAGLHPDTRLGYVHLTVPTWMNRWRITGILSAFWFTGERVIGCRWGQVVGIC